MIPRSWLVRTLEPLVWWLMVKFTKTWANHYMDQFENWKFEDSYGNETYVSVSYHTEHPNIFLGDTSITARF